MGNITCKWCGSTGLSWSMSKKNPVSGKPYLVNEKGDIHNCMHSPIRQFPDDNREMQKVAAKVMEERMQKLAQDKAEAMRRYQYRNLPRFDNEGLQKEQQRRKQEQAQKEEEQHQEEQKRKEAEQKEKEEAERRKREEPWNGEHEMLADLILRSKAGLNVLLVGPAGGGKSHGAFMVAERLGWAFYPQSVGPQTSKSDLIGYTNGNTGALVRTVLREAYEFGGLYLLDEIDAGNPGVLTVLNAILANGVCAFPDGVIKKHPMFRCIAAANTYGQGATRTYVGRQPLDGATTDRFTGLDWGYDEKMEAYLGKSQPDWVLFVWQLRKAALKLDIKRIFGTRRIVQGCTLLDLGIPLNKVKEETVFFGVTPDERKRLEANL